MDFFTFTNNPRDIGLIYQPKKWYPYTSHKRDVWDILGEADRNPHNENEIILLYTRYSIPPGPPGEEYRHGWTREHCWPQSLGNMSINKPGMGTDAHNLFCADRSINSTRKNKYYDIGGDPVRDYSPAEGYSGETECKSSLHSWEPPNNAKGVVARAIFYMRCVYHTSGLQIGEIPGPLCMAKLSTLLLWNRNHPPDDWEKRRSNIIAQYQGNENPFILYPKLADQIEWNPPLLIIPPSSKFNHIPVSISQPYFTKIHYDNKGIDREEGFELAVPKDYSVHNLVVYLYQGSKGEPYCKIDGNHLERGDVIEPNDGYLYYYQCTLQNGPRNGLAIVSQSGKVYDFISYEGALLGKSGPCSGRWSIDIGVRQNRYSSIKSCLQRIGCSHKWKVSRNKTFGKLNLDEDDIKL